MVTPGGTPTSEICSASSAVKARMSPLAAANPRARPRTARVSPLIGKP
jgi:hypothetical protein